MTRARGHRLFVVLLAAMALSVAGCTSSSSTAGPASSAPGNGPGTTADGSGDANGQLVRTTTPTGEQVAKLGALVSLTGPGAPYGESQLRGLELAVRDMNERRAVPGVHFELAVRDDGSDVEQARTAMTELIERERIIALFGPTLSSIAAEVDRIAVAAGVPVMAISNTTLDILTIGDPAWRVALTDPALARSNLELVKDRFGVHTVGLIWDPKDPRSRVLAQRFREAADGAGVRISGEVDFGGSAGDLASTLQKARDLDVEALMIAATGEEARRLFGAIAQGETSLDFNALGNSVWRVALSERTVIPRAVAAAHDRAAVTSAVLAFDPDDPYSSGAADAFRSGAAAAGITIVEEVTYTSGSDPSFDRAFAAATSGRANGFFVAALSAEAAAFLEQRAAAGLTHVPVVGGDGFFDDPLMRRLGAAADNLLVGAAWLASEPGDTSQAFVEEFRVAHGTTPDQWAALAYAGVELVVAAVHAKGEVASRSTIRTGLLELKEVPTVVGSVTFSELREAQYPGLVVTARDGVFVRF